MRCGSRLFLLTVYISCMTDIVICVKNCVACVQSA